MKISKILKLSIATSTILIITACGGGSGGGEIKTPKLTNITTIEEAKSSFQAISATDSLNGISNEVNQKSSNYNKTNSNNCLNGGTVTIIEEGSTNTIIAKNCTNGNYYINGSLSFTQNSDESEIITMSNLTAKDGKIDFYSSKLTVVENENEHWSTIDGDISVTSKCFSGNYNFETIEKIYDVQDNSDNAESGILKINGVTYTFDNPYVTIKLGDKEETILQSELTKQIENSTSCSE